MPTVFEWKGWKFLFYSQDIGEPPHIHARKDRKEAKLWLEGPAVARNRRCTQKEVNALFAIVGERPAELLEKWHEHFGNR